MFNRDLEKENKFLLTVINNLYQQNELIRAAGSAFFYEKNQYFRAM